MTDTDSYPLFAPYPFAPIAIADIKVWQIPVFTMSGSLQGKCRGSAKRGSREEVGLTQQSYGHATPLRGNVPMPLLFANRHDIQPEHMEEEVEWLIKPSFSFSSQMQSDQSVTAANTPSS